MKILMIVLNWVGKGTYWRAFNLAKYLVLQGHQVTLIATSCERRFVGHRREVEGVQLIETPDLLTGSLRSGWDIWNTLYRLSWVQGQSFDLVHAFEARPTVLLPALYLRHIRGIPLVMDWADWFGRGGSIEERSQALMRFILRPIETFFEETFRTQAHATTVICNPLRERALALGVAGEHILLLPNGADVASIPIQNRLVVRKRLSLTPDKVYLGHTGSIFQGDAELMAAAFNQIYAQYPQTRLLLISYFNREIEKMVQVPEAVIRTGPVSQVDFIDYVAACDLGFLPWRNTLANQGRFPLKVHDFLSAARPIVATDVGDMGMLLKQYPLGRLAPDDPQALAEAVLGLLNEPDETIAAEQTARQVAETEFACDKIVESLIDFYQMVLAKAA